MKYLLLLGLLLSKTTLSAVNFHDFDAYQNVFSQEEIEAKIQQFLEKDSTITRFYKITSEALYIGDIAHQKIDYTLHLTNSQQPIKKHTTQSTLKGAKIAIDPGHFGGIFAKLEERYVTISPKESKLKQSITFDEGTLTYLTAVELKSLLQAEGASVLITRPGIGQGVIKETFFEWLQNHPELWESKEPLSNLFCIDYNRADLVARTEKINAFAPEITIIIHYNAHDPDHEKNSNTHLVQSDYNVAFIPGAFCTGELNSEGDRYEFLRLIVTDALEQSLKLSQNIVSQFTKQLKIPLFNERASHSEDACLLQQPGIYSRNLALTRLIHSPVCYGETLVQNSWQEFLKLGTNDTEVNGMPCPSRVKEVARAYFEGIKSYFESTNPEK